MGTRDLIGAITGNLLQSDRLMKLDTVLGPNMLVPQRAVGRSRLGRHFEFTVDAVSTWGDLELKELIAQPVTLWIQQSDRSYQPHNGYVHTARRLGSNGGLTTYQLTFASWMHFLKFRRDQRIWQEKTVDDIITDVFKAHPQSRGWFQFALSNPLPARSYCRQDEDDWNFVHRLLESEGLFGFWRQAEDGTSHTLIITDHLTKLDDLIPKTVPFYRGDTGSETDALVQWSGTRTLQSTMLTTRTFDYKSPSTPHYSKGTSVPTMPNQGTLPNQAEVYEYTGAYTYPRQDRGDQLSRIRIEEWESRAKRFLGIGSVRRIDAGRRFVLQGHPDHDQDQTIQNEFAVIETVWVIANNLPMGGHESAFPHTLQDSVEAMRAKHADAPTSKASNIDGASGFFLTEIEAQRISVPYHSPFEHRKPETHLESAIVVGPTGEEIYTDELNRIKVQYIWDRLNGGDEKSSCWIRVAQSDTGSGYGSVHTPRVGEEVLIDCIGGDCDRPVVISRLYNNAARPRWHTHGLLSGYRSKEYGGSAYNQLAMDDATSQNRVHLYSSSYHSHLHLGYLVRHSDNSRGPLLGKGFDLKSEAYGAIRAGQGLFVSTHPAANGQPLDAKDATEQLASAGNTLGHASRSSIANQAESLNEGHDALKKFTDATQHNVAESAPSGGRTGGGGSGNANGFSTPIMLIASPAGVGVSTQESAQFAANQHVNIVSGRNTNLAAGKSLIASVIEKISLFAQNAGVKLFAAKGNVEIRAHTDNVELTAQKTVKVLSATERIEIAAQQEILLTCGGAYIRIQGGNIEIHAPGNIDVKGAKHAFDGPASMRYPLPDLPGEKPYSAQFTVQDGNGEILRNYPYRMEAENGVTWYGHTDENGLTERVWFASQQVVHLYPHDGSHHDHTNTHVDDLQDCRTYVK